MSDEAKVRGEIALELEHQAVDLLSEAVDHGITAADDLTPQMRAQLLLQTAQARATLAQSIRLGELTDRLGEYLGDDSSLDRLQQALRDPESARNLVEVLTEYLPGRMV